VRPFRKKKYPERQQKNRYKHQCGHKSFYVNGSAKLGFYNYDAKNSSCFSAILLSGSNEYHGNQDETRNKVFLNLQQTLCCAINSKK